MIRRWRSVWNAPSASPAPPTRVWRDWLLVALLPLLAVFEGLVRTDLPNALAAVVVLIAIVPTLLWRRTHPLLMLVISFAVTSVFRLVTGHDLGLYTSVLLLLIIYSVFRWGSGRAIVVGLAIMVASTLASTLAPPIDLTNLIGGFAFLSVVGLLGLLLRFAARSRMRELDRAKANERAELARDLHDTVAHHVSAIAIQAQAGLATAGTNPDAATTALRVIEGEASRTLSEMRSMVRMLRGDDEPTLAPAGRLDDLHRLADGTPPVALTSAGDLDRLPELVAAAVYRIAQESITNARRHARGATRIDVHVAVEGDRVHLTVRDDGAGGAAVAPGYGITGMTERAALLGGVCTAGPAPGGGWIVTADLPRGGALA
ncbi:sensor histidine kinase [Pseudolysinimonas yzui]|nr:histidine kinase [Pseudolysinimonas yzui]